MPQRAQRAQVVRLVDGDTVLLRGTDAGPLPGSPTRVRVIGLDTPEIGEREECFGPQAAERAAALLPARAQVWVVRDRDGADRYGRSLLHVWTPDGRLLSRVLISEGFATALLVRPNDRYAGELARAQDEARSARRGLWSACR